MGALTIAFDTTIVGALALPWVFLIVHLFFFEDEERFTDLLSWVNQKGLQAIAGVLLFAMAFTLGSAVSRIAQDFFNDDDLFLQLGPHLLRAGTTEDHILASVYCDADENQLLRSDPSNALLSARITDFQQQKPACRFAMIWMGRLRYSRKNDHLADAARDVFGLQENALLLKGEDATLRLRQLHDQIMVLRGSTFDGMIAFAFCLYAWGLRARRERPRSLARVLLACVPAVFLLLAADAFVHHYEDRFVSEPPYMEFSLLIVGLAGGWLLWLPRRRAPRAGGPESRLNWRWGMLSLVFAVLFTAGFLGWWSTEVLYGHQVIYSYDAQLPAPAAAASH